MTYGRSRLLLGTTAVGLVTLSASGLLISQAHTQALNVRSTQGASEFLLLLTAVAVWAAALLPFDFVGGYILPSYFRRDVPDLPRFILAWARGVIVQTMLIAALLWSILQVGQLYGFVAAVALVVVAQAGLLACQKQIAAIVAHLKMISPESGIDLGMASRYAEFSHTDTGFTGTIVGLPGAEEVIVPQSWYRQLAPDQLRAEFVRRCGAIQSGSRTRGVLLAISINTITFAACTQLPTAGVFTVSELVSTSLYFTILSFLWLLLLPRWSREGVFEADRYAFERGISVKVIENTAESIEALHDDEPRRSRSLESVFHPVPCVRRRVAELSLRLRPIRGYWNVARLTLFLSWPCGGFLSRAVHCNIGRPELWVLLPTD